MRALLVILILVIPFGHPAAGEPALHAVVYHDVRDQGLQPTADAYVVYTRRLIEHFSWLRANGYSVIGIDDLMDARDNRRPLPEKAVLLTFDDGLRSVYTRVFPLLKLFGYKAVVSVVTGWMEPDTNHDGTRPGVENFITPRELREMQASGLIEIASHSHDLHRGIVGNPQGNLQPASATRLYMGEAYEDELAYAARMEADLARSAALLEQYTGKRPRVITWPYGASNELAEVIAARLGMQVSLTTQPDLLQLGKRIVVGRTLLTSNPDIRDFAAQVTASMRTEVVRAAQVDLDYVYDPDPQRQEANLGLLLDRIKALGISHVFLQAFADPDGDGAADALYFPNRHLPVRSDLFNRAAWQLATRSGVKVYAWMPLLGFQAAGIDPELYVQSANTGKLATGPMAGPRLSPFNPKARRIITDIYEDLATYSGFAGIHFHDDAVLGDFEDASPAAMAVYRSELGMDFAIAKAHENRGLMERWSQLKADQLTRFSMELTDVVRRYRPDILTSRNLFARVVLDPESVSYMAQRFDGFLQHYDYVALMAMPFLENAAEPFQFYDRLIAAVRARPSGIRKTIFQLQTVDWTNGRPLSSEQLLETMRYLKTRGIRHLAYYPDDFIANRPRLEELRQGISLAEIPGSP